MKRRSFLAAPAALPLAAQNSAFAQSPGKSRSWIELRYIYFRNTTDNQRQKTTDFLSKAVIPALNRAGSSPVGLFASSIAPKAPFVLLAIPHNSLAAFEQCWDKLDADPGIAEGYSTYVAGLTIPMQRMQVELLFGFPGFPKIVPPAAPAEGQPARVFELRTYESSTPATLAKKVGMFEQGEIEIFKKTGLNPVFFGVTAVGTNMPNLTYMLSHDSLAARESNWRNFVTSPEWKKMAAMPGYSDGEIVSNISTMLLSPVAGSQIR